MFLSPLGVILSSLHLNFLPPPLTPPSHHKHTPILKQEVLDHINSDFQSPHVPSPITSPPPLPQYRVGVGRNKASWTLLEDFLAWYEMIRYLVYLFIYSFIYLRKKIEFRIFRLPNSEFRHSCFSNLPFGGLSQF